MKIESLKIISVFALIILFSYTGFTKLFNNHEFVISMGMQELPHWMIGVIVRLLPILEILISVLLVITLTRPAGLYLSLILLCSFSIYIILGITHVFKRIPCACGGPIKYFSWTQHLLFNLIFMGLCVFNIIHSHRYEKTLTSHR